MHFLAMRLQNHGAELGAREIKIRIVIQQMKQTNRKERIEERLWIIRNPCIHSFPWQPRLATMRLLSSLPLFFSSIFLEGFKYYYYSTRSIPNFDATTGPFFYGTM
jgi:hypothetical protein